MRAIRPQAWYRLCRCDLNEGSSLARKIVEDLGILECQDRSRATLPAGAAAGQAIRPPIHTG
jgi:hypothetical protein